MYIILNSYPKMSFSHFLRKYSKTGENHMKIQKIKNSK